MQLESSSLNLAAYFMKIYASRCYNSDALPLLILALLISSLLVSLLESQKRWWWLGEETYKPSFVLELE